MVKKGGREKEGVVETIFFYPSTHSKTFSVKGKKKKKKKSLRGKK